jgi:pimeloyl-ACP methyl ester carboxylesterase
VGALYSTTETHEVNDTTDPASSFTTARSAVARMLGRMNTTQTVQKVICARLVVVAAAQATTGSVDRDRMQPSNSQGQYATVNGLRMYYETDERDKTRPERPPLILLHGALSTIETDYGPIRAQLRGSRRLVAIEQQAHGHTADIDRPLSYEQMADDTVELLTSLGITQADFFGYSMGGGIALQVGLRHKGVARKIIFAGGASFDPTGFYPQLTEAQKTMKPADLAGSPYERDYLRFAPHPEDWPKLVGRVNALDAAWRGIRPEVLRSLTLQTLLIIGDSDVVLPEHTVQMFRLLGGGVPGDLVGLPRAQLAVLPGTTHATVLQRTNWLISMVTAFLDAPPA